MDGGTLRGRRHRAKSRGIETSMSERFAVDIPVKQLAAERTQIVSGSPAPSGAYGRGEPADIKMPPQSLLEQPAAMADMAQSASLAGKARAALQELFAAGTRPLRRETERPGERCFISCQNP